MNVWSFIYIYFCLYERAELRHWLTDRHNIWHIYLFSTEKVFTIHFCITITMRDFVLQFLYAPQSQFPYNYCMF